MNAEMKVLERILKLHQEGYTYDEIDKLLKLEYRSYRIMNHGPNKQKLHDAGLLDRGTRVAIHRYDAVCAKKDARQIEELLDSGYEYAEIDRVLNLGMPSEQYHKQCLAI